LRRSRRNPQVASSNLARPVFNKNGKEVKEQSELHNRPVFNKNGKEMRGGEK